LTTLWYREQAGFYRAALLLGLVPGKLVVRWADAILARADAPPAFVEIATTAAEDLSALREALLAACDEKPSAPVVRAILDLVGRDLKSGRRSVADTMTVLGQLRRFLAIGTAVNEEIKTLELRFIRAKERAEMPDFERQVGDWLAQYDAAESTLFQL
jgi:hypothetical protein